MIRPLALAFGLAVSGCAVAAPPPEVPADARPSKPTKTRAEIVFAAGCFWCVEEAFETAPGVIEAISGFTGGHAVAPSYKQVVRGGTGHTEAVRVVYDPRKTDVAALLEIYWHNVDPFDGTGQFCDRGPGYRPGIFYATDHDKALAFKTKAAVEARFSKPVAVEIAAWTAFYPAETEHQDYFVKNPTRYGYYKWGCGRKARLVEIWGDDAK